MSTLTPVPPHPRPRFVGAVGAVGAVGSVSRAVRLGVLSVVACGLLCASPLAAEHTAAAQDPPTPPRDLSTELATVMMDRASIQVPKHWRVGNLGSTDIQSMQSLTLTLSSPDERIRLHVLLIDPFGLDPGWTLTDVLGPTLADLLVQAGARDNELKEFFDFPCEVSDQTTKGRLVNIQFERSTADPLVKEQRLLSGVACGLSQRDRWVAFFLLLDTDNTRPALMRQLLEEARYIMKSFKFD